MRTLEDKGESEEKAGGEVYLYSHMKSYVMMRFAFSTPLALASR